MKLARKLKKAQAKKARQEKKEAAEAKKAAAKEAKEHAAAAKTDRLPPLVRQRGHMPASAGEPRGWEARAPVGR